MTDTTSSSSSASDKEESKFLTLLQVAAVGTILLIALIVYNFRHLNGPTSASFPNVPASAPYRHPLPQIEADGDGTHLSLDDLRGQWTLLSFWAHSCVPCLTEMPLLNQLNEEWSGPEMNVVTINLDSNTQESMENVQSFLTNYDIQLPVFYDPNGALKQKFSVQEIPRHFLISPELQIVWDAVGAFTWTSKESQAALLSIIDKSQEKTKGDAAEEVK